MTSKPMCFRNTYTAWRLSVIICAPRNDYVRLDYQVSAGILWVLYRFNSIVTFTIDEIAYFK